MLGSCARIRCKDPIGRQCRPKGCRTGTTAEMVKEMVTNARPLPPSHLVSKAVHVACAGDTEFGASCFGPEQHHDTANPIVFAHPMLNGVQQLGDAQELCPSFFLPPLQLIKQLLQ